MPIVLFLLWILSIDVWGDALSQNENFLHVKRLTRKDGFPEAAVHAILQDSRGFMWFGSLDGLTRYDGTETRTYRPDPNDPNSLSHNVVLDIDEDAQSNLWICTEGGGLNRWDRATETFTHYRNVAGDLSTLSSDALQCLLPDPDGTFWIASKGGGLNHFDPRNGKNERLYFTSPNRQTPNDNMIFSLFRDHEGMVWIGTETGGLNRFDPRTGEFRYYVHDRADPRGLNDNTVKAIAEDREGYLWLGTNHGISRLDPSRQFFDHFECDPLNPEALQAPVVDAVTVDGQGQVWIGTDGGGLHRYRPSDGKFIGIRSDLYEKNSLVSNVIRCVYADRNNDLWVGHFPAGISYSNRLNAPFRVLRHKKEDPNSLADDFVQALIEDPSGDLWVGTDNAGLNHWNRASGRWTAYQHRPGEPNSLGAKAATSLLRDRRGRLWVGTFNGGLNLFEPETGTFRQYLPDPAKSDSLSSPQVWSMVEDRLGRIWVATSGGIDRLDSEAESFRHYRLDFNNPHSLPSDLIWCLLLTRDGTLWAGTHAGLARYVPSSDSWERFESRPETPGALSHNWVTFLFEDKAGRLWISTEGGGLNVFDPDSERFDRYRTQDGLSSNTVRSILQDEEGFIWVSTNNGLCRLDPVTRRIQTYDENNGLQGNLFNGRACLKSRGGELYFGGTQGLTVFQPRDVKSNPIPPPVVLTRFEILNQTVLPGQADSPLRQSITETKRLEIPFRDSVISFQFAALNFRSPEQNRYAFRLEGFDPDWRQTGHERRVTYTNLDPGRYRLRVKASNNEGVWNEEGTSLNLIVRPMWWQTWWAWGTAFLLLASALLGTGWAVATLRSRERLRAAEALRESEERFRRIFQESADPILLIAGEIYVDCNSATLAKLGASNKAEIVGQTPWAISPERQPDGRLSAEKTRELIALALENGSHEFEWTHRRFDGSILYFEIMLTPITLQGKTIVHTTWRDITERKRAEAEMEKLEAQLLHSQKMEAVGRLAGGVAHDFNNMLGVILGYAELAINSVPPENPIHTKLQEIRKAAQRSADLTRQLLAFARKQTVSPRVLDLNETVSGMLKMLQRLIGEDIELVWKPGAGLGSIRMDPAQLDQILANLAVNARDAIPGVGTVTLETRNVEFDEAFCHSHPGTVPGRFVLLSVSDNGCGMDKETLARVFEPFFTTKEKGKGTGLGLATVYGIVQQNEGFINVSSESDWGTVFHIYLRRFEGGASPVPESTRPEIDLEGTETILLVEDEEAILRLGQWILEHQGYTVLASRTPREALARADEHLGKIDLLITDVIMPEMSGKVLSDRLRARRPDLQCLYISGYTADVITHHGVLEEGVHFLPKPFAGKSLTEKVREILDG